MFKFLLLTYLILPLIGIFLMEIGAFGIESYSFGHPNGASLVYLLFILVILFIYWVLVKIKLFRIKIRHISFVPSYYTIALIIMTINLLSLIYILFTVGTLEVFVGNVLKGELRANLGSHGIYTYLIRKMIAPLSLAYLTFHYVYNKKKKYYSLILGINFIIVGVIGASFGYKTSLYYILLPAILIFFWKISLKKFIKVATIIVISFIIFGIIYDGFKLKSLNFTNIDLKRPSQDNVIHAIVYRATVLTGDIPWKTWDLYSNDAELFDYNKTLLAIFGDRFLRNFNIDRENYERFAKYHYSAMLTTKIGGKSLSMVKNGHSTMGTVFSEAIIAGGIWGLLFFSVFVGILAAIIYSFIQSGFENNNVIAVALLSVFFCNTFLPWILGGGVVTMLHISNLLYFTFGYFFLFLLELSGHLIKEKSFVIKR